MNYWIDLFTGTTWQEFRDAGAKISGFRERMRNTCSKVRPGDILLCYLTGVMRWVGVLRVIGVSQNRDRIWKDTEFPVRFEVEPLVLVDPEYGVPMQQLEGRVEFYKVKKDAGKFKAFVRRSPNRFGNEQDGRLIEELLRQAESNPIGRPVDAKKLARAPNLYKVPRLKGRKRSPAVVSVPGSEESTPVTLMPAEAESVATPVHTEIQYYLLSLGAEVGLEVWVARNDRSKTWKDVVLGDMPRLVNELPTQFNPATHKTIELIDVLWLKGNSIVAAFEVESTTSIYSGLLRMSDLLALQPNLDIDLYLVAPDDRRGKVEQEILRPTFNLRERRLAEVCGFLAFSRLIETFEGIRKLGLASSLKPDFLRKTAEFFASEAES